MGVELECGVCHGEEETTEHVLLICSFVRVVWFSSLFGYQLSRNTQISFKEWLLVVLERKDVDFEMACMIL